jgi:hypothetical protein
LEIHFADLPKKSLHKSHYGKKYLFIQQVIDYCTLPPRNPIAEGRRALIRNMWNERIQGVKRNVEVDMGYGIITFLTILY